MKARMIGGLATLILAAVAVVALTRGDATRPTASKGQSELAKVRAATSQFHDVAKAEQAGYGKLLDCFDSPEGGMGQHYVKQDALDAELNPATPEALVYEVGGDRLKLVGVEYIVPKDAWTQAAPPTLFGQTFLSNDELKLWVLHAWVWRANPNGTFVNFNPTVKACPAAGGI